MVSFHTEMLVLDLRADHGLCARVAVYACLRRQKPTHGQNSSLIGWRALTEGGAAQVRACVCAREQCAPPSLDQFGMEAHSRH